MCKRLLVFTLQICAGLGLFSHLYAQTNTATLTGRLSDPSGAAIVGGAVTVTNTETQVQQTTETNSAGIYSFPALLPGPYAVSASASGFRRISSTISLTVGQTVQLDLSATVGSNEEQVTVTAENASIEAESHDLQTTLSSSSIENLPASGGRLFDVLATAADTKPFDNNLSSGISFFGDPSDSLTIGGMQPGSTTYLEDGANNVALIVKSANIQPSIEAVQEASLISTGASARYMEPSVVNVITKSGTSSFHGRAYDYLRNNWLNTNQYFDSPPEPLRYNLFGANLGGPILRKKLFFFFDFSALRNYNSGVVGAWVPTLAHRQGDFSAAGDPIIYDPSTWNPTTGTISQFPGNKITNISSFATQFLNYYPVPNGSKIPGTNFSKAIRNSSTYNTYLGRLDYTLGKSDQIFGAWETSNPHQIYPNWAAVNYFDGLRVQFATDAYVEETHAFSSNLFNIAKFAYNGGNVQESIAGVGAKNFVAEFGLQGLTPTPNQWAPPSANIYGVNGFSYPYSPQGGTQKSYQFSDEVNLTKGRHSIFAGVELDKIGFDGLWTLYSDGQYTFNGQYTGNHGTALPAGGTGVADFLLGFPSNSNGGTGVSSANFKEYDLLNYVQDDWRVTRTLTLNLGLRYDYLGAPSDPNGRSVIYDVTTNTNHLGSWHQNYLDFAPRFGFAKKIDKKTVIRGGYGIAHSTLIYGNLSWLVCTPPLFLVQSPNFDINTPTPVATSLSNNPDSSTFDPFAAALKMPTPKIQQWNLNIQRSLGANWLATIGYVGNKSDHIQTEFDSNQAALATPATSSLTLQQRRPYPWVGDVQQIANNGYGNYNAFDADLQKHFSGGYSLLATYTFSKAMDIQTTSGYNLQNGQNPSGDYGLNDINRKHDFKLSGVYDLPVGPGRRFLTKGIASQVVGGWQASAILKVRSGAPVTLYANDFTNTGDAGAERAGQTCNGNLGSKATRQVWFNTACYYQPGNAWGNFERGSIVGPRQTETDASLFKLIGLGGEGRKFELRSDFLNALNHPILSMPAFSQFVGAPGYGSIGGNISSGRTIQVSGKLIF
jgi:hypothetical protein